MTTTAHLFDSKRRLSANLDLLARAEGVVGLAPQDIIDVLAIRHEKTMDSQRMFAMTLFRTAQAVSEGGAYLDVMSHLYPDVPAIKEKVREEQERAKSEGLLERFRRLAGRGDLEEYECRTKPL